MSFSKKFDDDLLVVIVVDVVTQLMVRFDIVGNHATNIVKYVSRGRQQVEEVSP
jgi:hypothetical protein